MENGDSINSEYAFLDFCYDGDFPMRLNNTIIPYPQDSQKYIYFNLDINIISGMLPAPLHLYYHVVDMEMDNGLGAVIAKKQVAVSDTLNRGYVQAVRHANGIDWWVTTAEWNSNCYYVIPVNGTGVGLPEKQCLGGIWTDLDGGGQAAFSPDGKKYARIGGQVALYLFDFDDETGAFSNPVELTYPFDEEYFRGVAFSPNSRYLYVSAKLDLFQFDLEADDIQGSIQLVGQLDPDDAFPGVGTLALQKLAPDGKVYIASPGAHKFLSVINRPNCPGTLCDFKPWAIELPESNYAGLPNLPHFSIPETDNECDSLTNLANQIGQEPYRTFPNPANNKLFLLTDLEAVQYTIYDLMGMPHKQGVINNKISEIIVSDLTNGTYFLSVKTRNGYLMKGRKIVILKE